LKHLVVMRLVRSTQQFWTTVALCGRGGGALRVSFVTAMTCSSRSLDMQQQARHNRLTIQCGGAGGGRGFEYNQNMVGYYYIDNNNPS
jgi:hypothetical protein